MSHISITYFNSCHYCTHEVWDDEIVPQVQEPRLQLVSRLIKGAPHKYPRAEINNI